VCLLPSRTFYSYRSIFEFSKLQYYNQWSPRPLTPTLAMQPRIDFSTERGRVHTSPSPLDSDVVNGRLCCCGAWSFPMFSPPPPYFWVHPWLVLRFRGRRQFTGPGSTSSHQSYRGERNVFLLSPTPGEDGHQSKFDQCLELLNLLAWTRTDITEPQPPPRSCWMISAYWAAWSH